ncbi:MAG: YtxH domain-containing protein [Anaerolineales bacterium]|jgi:gas vesicle protein
MKRALSFFRGLIVGGVLGASVALILAPASGEELQKQLRERSDQIRNEVTQAAAARRAELEQQLATLRSPKQEG